MRNKLREQEAAGQHIEKNTDVDIPNKEQWLHLKKVLKEFRASTQAGASQPEAFWEKQRKSIRDRIAQKSTVQSRPLVWAWITLAVAVVLAVLLWVHQQPELKPDFAAGYDQQLLLDVERMLNQDAPAALKPASLIPNEIFPSARIIPAP